MEKKDISGYSFQIGTQYYYIEIVFYNGISEKSVSIPMFLVDSIEIEESLFQWWTNGSITLHNDFELIQKGALGKDAGGIKQYTKNILTDRPDGRNKICIRIFPLDKNGTDSFDHSKWEICHDFVVYDIQDQPSQDAQRKFKTYYFWDERYQLFLERNLDWSTATTAKKLYQIESFTSDIQRCLPPNIALKNLIKDASILTDDSSIKVGYKMDGEINKPTEDVGNIDEENWNNGKQDDENKIFYTSFSNSNVIDDINYILSLCSDENDFPVILDLGRTTDDKKFKLITLKDIFDNCLTNQIETLILEDNFDSFDNKSQHVPRGPVPQDNIANFISGLASKISSYQFSPMVNLDDKNLVTSPQHYFDFSNSEFNIKFSKNTIDDVLSSVKNMGENLYSFKNNNGQILAKINKFKKNTLSINNRFSALSQTPKNIPQINMLKDFVFLNQSLTFLTYGLTVRTPGKFVSIESINSNELKNAFWDRFLGQWLIINVKHIFRKELYTNQVTTVKIDSFNPVWEIEDSDWVA
jgi:hypothetical protein